MENEIAANDDRSSLSSERLVTNKQLRELLGGVSEMHIWRLLKDPKNAALKFPVPIHINRRNYWRLADVRRWIDRQAVRTGQAA
jgi:predicted DNA-binding transcriptional regulator AlpA